MKCPECNSENTKKPSVISKRWKVGTQICKDCDHQSDWIDFCDSISQEEKDRIKNQSDKILSPLYTFFDPNDPRIKK